MSTAMIYRLSVALDDFASEGWRREHFADKTEADAAERIFIGGGRSVVRHELKVPLEPAKLAQFLNTYAQ